MSRQLALWFLAGGLVLYFGGILVLSRHARAHQRWLWRVPEDASGLQAFLLIGAGAVRYIAALIVVLAFTIMVIWLWNRP